MNQKRLWPEPEILLVDGQRLFLFLEGAGKRPQSTQKEAEAGGKKKPQRIISDSEGSRQELSPEDLCRKQPVLLLTPLNPKKLPEKKVWPRRERAEQYVPKRGGEPNGRGASLDRELTRVKYALRSQKRPRQNGHRTEISSPEDNASSEDFPRITRRAQPSFRREAPDVKPVPDPKQQSHAKKPPSAAKRTGGPSGPSSHSRPTRAGPPHQNGEPGSPPSPPRSANDSPAIQRPSGQHRLRQGRQKKYVFESESESESSPGDFAFKRGELKAPGKGVNGADPGSAQSGAAAGRMAERRGGWDADGSEEGWTEEELQKLHR